MLKYLLLILIVIWLFYSPAIRRQIKQRPEVGKGSKNAEQSPPPSPQIMLTCAHCGIHFPQSEAWTSGTNGQGPHYCSAEHLRAGPRQA